MLVTKEYGPAIRLSTILTDAPLDCGTPIEASKCGECRECVSACPTKTITGQEWDLAASRTDPINSRNLLIDPIACYGQVYSLSEKLDITAAYARIYDFCIAACPHTKRYVSSIAPTILPKQAVNNLK